MLPNAGFGTDLTGTVRGKWGFEAFEGPSFRLQSAHARKWVIPAGDKSALIVGREDVLHLRGDDAVCVKEVTVKDKQGKAVKPGWKLAKPDELELKLPLKNAAAGPMSIQVKKYGMEQSGRALAAGILRAWTPGRPGDSCRRPAERAERNQAGRGGQPRPEWNAFSAGRTLARRPERRVAAGRAARQPAIRCT